MKKLLLALLLLPTFASAKPYLHLGFNELSGGYFFPLAGNIDAQQAGFITPVLEHDAADGSILIPGVNYHLLNLGYVGEVNSVDNFLHGKLALGPSIQTGDLVKDGLRALCRLSLPQWGDNASYGLMKAVLAPGKDGMYADVGVYGALPLNGIFPLSHLKPELLIGATLNKRYGGAAPAAK